MSHHDHVLVIGPGEVGRRLAQAFRAAGSTVDIVSRREGWGRAADAREKATRVLAMREDDLPPALARLDDAGVPRERLVLVQNGFLEARLAGLEEATRALIWFTAKGERFFELRASVVHGALSGAVAAACDAGGLRCEIVPDRDAFLRAMIEKALWNAIVGLPLAVAGLSLAEYLPARIEEWHALVGEGAAAAGAHYGVGVDEAGVRALILETTKPIGWVRVGEAKALSWRNGAIARFGRAHGVPTPTHDRLLRAAGFEPDAR